ncbi:MAG: hypothetical protein ACT4P4_22755 [Betaproteobacteria bacterium]
MLAALAVPAYLDYAVRSEVSSGLVLAAGARAKVAERFARAGAADM